MILVAAYLVFNLIVVGFGLYKLLSHPHYFPEWKQVDKVGHFYSAYIESRASMELWRWTGIDRKKRIWIGGMSGAFYQTVIEILDGFSAGWGWSWAARKV